MYLRCLSLCMVILLLMSCDDSNDVFYLSVDRPYYIPIGLIGDEHGQIRFESVSADSRDDIRVSVYGQSGERFVPHAGGVSFEFLTPGNYSYTVRAWKVVDTYRNTSPSLGVGVSIGGAGATTFLYPSYYQGNYYKSTRNVYKVYTGTVLVRKGERAVMRIRT